MKHNYLITDNRNIVSEISLMTEEDARLQLTSRAQHNGGRPVFMLRLEEYAEADVSFFAGNTDIGHKVKARVNRITPDDIGFDDETRLEDAVGSAVAEQELQMRRVEPIPPTPWPPGLRELQNMNRAIQVATGTLTRSNRRGPFD